SRRLVFGVVQLRESIGNFAPRHEQFKPLGDVRVGVRRSGQRRYFYRVINDKGRIPQLGLRRFFKQGQLQGTDAGSCKGGAIGVDSLLAQLGTQVICIVQVGLGIARSVLQDRLYYGQTIEGLAKVERFSLIGKL